MASAADRKRWADELRGFAVAASSWVVVGVIIGVGGWIVIGVVLVGVVFAAFGLDRYRGARRAATKASRPTDEVFTDPSTGKPMRVWYNPATGEREYRPE